MTSGGHVRAILLLILILGCSSRKFYQGPELSQELRRNEAALGLVLISMESDFEQKVNFLNKAKKISRDTFILNNLTEKMKELKASKDSVVSRTNYLKRLNQKLLEAVSEKYKIREGDATFNAVEDFAEDKGRELGVLKNDILNYQKSAEEFEDLAQYTLLVMN